MSKHYVIYTYSWNVIGVDGCEYYAVLAYGTTMGW